VHEKHEWVIVNLPYTSVLREIGRSEIAESRNPFVDDEVTLDLGKRGLKIEDHLVIHQAHEWRQEIGQLTVEYVDQPFQLCIEIAHADQTAEYTSGVKVELIMGCCLHGVLV